MAGIKLEVNQTTQVIVYDLPTPEIRPLIWGEVGSRLFCSLFFKVYLKKVGITVLMPSLLFVNPDNEGKTGLWLWPEMDKASKILESEGYVRDDALTGVGSTVTIGDHENKALFLGISLNQQLRAVLDKISSALESAYEELSDIENPFL